MAVETHNKEWHWQEKDCTEWSRRRLRELLVDRVLPLGDDGRVTLTDLKATGDAYINTRKGKRIVGFDLNITIDWSGHVGEEEVQGRACLPYVCEDVDEHAFQVTITPRGSTEAHKRAGIVLQKDGVPEILRCVRQWVAELTDHDMIVK